MGPLIYLNKPELYTVPLFLALLNSAFISVLLIFLFAQRYVIAGLTVSSWK